MEPNPYQSPQHYLKRDPPKPLPTAPWFWVAFWIVIPLAIANLIHTTCVLILNP